MIFFDTTNYDYTANFRKLSFFVKPKWFHGGFRYKPHFFLCGQFHAKLTKNGGIFSVFFLKKWNWLWFHTWNWLELWNLSNSVRKIETDGRGEAACRQFQFFFLTEFGGFIISCQFHVCNHQPVSFFDAKKSEKSHHFFVSFTWNCATIK